MVVIEVNKETCIGCGECVDICPAYVYKLVNNKSEPVNMDACIECCSCVEVCPTNSINHESC
ncbi:MAG TPA: 4Fe-4S dicluster domain-containing protein [Euryarchaeota archaeon]|nr:ferredoxin-2 [archaeon]HEQ78531.1 4Fe-4S dicluster domain-containing protein [Euryarchaeota archaeon]